MNTNYVHCRIFVNANYVQCLRLTEERFSGKHWRMGRGGHGFPKVLLGPTMPDPSMPCGRASPETALRPFWG
jgi:hypothetical protein